MPVSDAIFILENRATYILYYVLILRGRHSSKFCKQISSEAATEVCKDMLHEIHYISNSIFLVHHSSK